MKKKEVLRHKKYHISFAEYLRLIRNYDCKAFYSEIARQNAWHPLSYRYSKQLHRKPYKEA
jgi:hypothetical protein